MCLVKVTTHCFDLDQMKLPAGIKSNIRKHHVRPDLEAHPIELCAEPHHHNLYSCIRYSVISSSHKSLQR